jgi:hypothetical protein
MRCLECSGPISAPGLVVAMEQREHFAMVRHAEVCNVCALAILPVFKTAMQKSLHWRQSVNCFLCNSKLPIARLRFDIRDRVHLHIAVCQQCYEKLREDLLKFSNFVGFFEKEWQTLKTKNAQRLPWPEHSSVRVRESSGHKLAGQIGCTESFRCLVQPWFGYNVRFSHGVRHFFHERDLELVNIEELARKKQREALRAPPASGPGDSPAPVAPPRPGGAQPQPGRRTGGR